MLNLNDVFWTFQGEGRWAGRRAFFVRMPYCNLECEWCDTTFNKFDQWDEKHFEEFALKEKSRFAVITGGEPMMNKHTPKVLEILKSKGFYVAAETNGTFPAPRGFDYITCSPKRQSKAQEFEPYYIHPDIFREVHEFKYVVDRFFDFSVLNKHSVFDGRNYSLSPEFGEMEVNLHKIFGYIQEHPQWQISLQTHKIMKIP